MTNDFWFTHLQAIDSVEEQVSSSCEKRSLTSTSSSTATYKQRASETTSAFLEQTVREESASLVKIACLQ